MINLANQMLANNEDHWRKESGVYYPPQAPDIIFITRSQQAVCPPQQGGTNIVMNPQASMNENRYLIEICEVLEANPSTCIAGYFTSS